MQRRALLASIPAASFGAFAAACGTSEAQPAPRTGFVLVHGSWHGGWAWEKVATRLVARGHVVATPDLPGHGLSAKLPAATFARPFDASAYATEQSPLAAIRLADYTGKVAATIDALLAAGTPVVLVGHSMGGIVLNALGERYGPRLKRLVYLSAFMMPSGVPPIAAFTYPTQSDSLGPPTAVADPAVLGTIRIDPKSPDPAYRARLKAALYADVADDEFVAVLNLLSTEHPLGPFTEATALTTASFGAVPRTYVRCAQDFAIRPATQDRFVADIDAAFPTNRTDVQRLATSHSPFLSAPDELANLLAGLA